MRYYCKKLSKTSKSRDHVDALEVRLQLCERGEIKSLWLKAETIQQKLTSSNEPKNIVDVSKRFAKLMEKGNINGALKLLANNMIKGILPLDGKALNSSKH